MPEDVVDFEFEFYSEDMPNSQLDDDLRMEADSRLRALAEGRTDMIGASVAVEKPAHGETAYIYQARIVAFIRPDNIVAVEKEDSAMAALQAALDAVERQVRERREQFHEPWKQP
jgi:ribosome-associated translation inhibitor RaiA